MVSLMRIDAEIVRRDNAARHGPIALGVIALLLVTVGTALAHDTWLLPSTLRVPVGQTVTLSLTSGMAFPVDDFAILPTRVTRADVRLAGHTLPLASGRSGTGALRYTWTPKDAGVAAFAVELAPKTLTLTKDKVTEYLDEIGASPGLRATWSQMPAPKRWRESYSKHAATFVRVGNPRDDSTWVRPMGLGLEIVPERDPTMLVSGDTLSVRVVRGGRPLVGFVVGARHAGATTSTFWPTDAQGRARVVLPSAGQWLIAGTDLRRSAKQNLEWESDFVTVTLSVAKQ